MKPFFLTLPHHSLQIPREVENRIQISDQSLREIGEAGIEKVFCWTDVKRIEAQAHQCFANLNRDRTNTNPNTNRPYKAQKALFPTQDFHADPIYKQGSELQSAEKEYLLQKYYDPFFDNISECIESGEYTFFADVHAMNCCVSYDQIDEDRPEICLGNRGDEEGRECADRDFITFEPEIMRYMRDFLLERGYECQLNIPFSGGHIIQKHHEFPCFQIEIRKDVFLTGDDGKIISDKAMRLRVDFGDLFDRVLEYMRKK